MCGDSSSGVWSVLEECERMFAVVHGKLHMHSAPLYKQTHERPLLMQYMGSALCDTTHKSTSPVASSAREKRGVIVNPLGMCILSYSSGSVSIGRAVVENGVLV